MGRSNGNSRSQIEFQHDEPATFPARTYSGHRVKIKIIRAMTTTHEEFKRASESADKLNRLLRRAINPNSIPPAAIGGQR